MLYCRFFPTFVELSNSFLNCGCSQPIRSSPIAFATPRCGWLGEIQQSSSDSQRLQYCSYKQRLYSGLKAISFEQGKRNATICQIHIVLVRTHERCTLLLLTALALPLASAGSPASQPTDVFTEVLAMGVLSKVQRN